VEVRSFSKRPRRSAQDSGAVERYESTLEIGVPLRTAYNQFTQFEDFPNSMYGVVDVEQVDDAHLQWRISVAGKDRQWDVEIREQVPDELIEWEGTSDPPNAGEVRFESLPDERTRLSLEMEYELEVGTDHADYAVCVVESSIDKALADFRRFIEERGTETGGWRGEIHDGVRTGPAGVGTPEEPLPGCNAR
jgi:uncharacterized membrane protein